MSSLIYLFCSTPWLWNDLYPTGESQATRPLSQTQGGRIRLLPHWKRQIVCVTKRRQIELTPHFWQWKKKNFSLFLLHFSNKHRVTGIVLFFFFNIRQKIRFNRIIWVANKRKRVFFFFNQSNLKDVMEMEHRSPNKMTIKIYLSNLVFT